MKSKKIVALLLSLVLLLAFAAGCAEKPVAPPSEAPASEAPAAPPSEAPEVEEPAVTNVGRTVEEIKADGEVVIGVFSDKQPFGFIDANGAYQGYDVYFADRIGKDLGVTVKYVSVEPASRVEFLETDKVDIILANFTVTAERKEKVDFALPYMKVALGVVSPDSALITDVSQLEGKTLIVSKGTTAETYFTDNHPEVTLLKFDGYTETINAMLDGRGDAWSTDNTEVLAWALQNAGFTVGIPTLGSLDTIAPAVKKGNASLLNWINEEIVALGDEDFFHADYAATLESVYGTAVSPDELVVEGGVLEPETTITPATIKIGATAVPHAEILEAAKPLLLAKGITLEIVEFTDYVQPNLTLESGELDANFFQHRPYLDDFNGQNDTHIVALADVHYEPLGIYPGKSTSLADLKDGAQIAVPNDTTNEARALLLLEANGLIKLKDGSGLSATVNDIAENTKNLKIVELEAAQIPRSLQDVDVAVINGNYALEAGLNAATDALASEASDSLAAETFANIIAVREGDEARPELVELVKVLQSKEIVEFINSTYEGGVVPKA
jgi:YaeC family lipoprotein